MRRRQVSLPVLRAQRRRPYRRCRSRRRFATRKPALRVPRCVDLEGHQRQSCSEVVRQLWSPHGRRFPRRDSREFRSRTAALREAVRKPAYRPRAHLRKSGARAATKDLPPAGRRAPRLSRSPTAADPPVCIDASYEPSRWASRTANPKPREVPVATRLKRGVHCLRNPAT